MGSPTPKTFTKKLHNILDPLATSAKYTQGKNESTNRTENELSYGPTPKEQAATVPARTMQ